MKKVKNIKVLIIDILFVLAIVLMTVGFAAYGQLLQLGGTAVIRGNGRVYISDVDTVALVNATANPAYTDSSIDFNLSFTTSSGQSNYSAEFDITITNDSVHDITYSAPTFLHRINRQSNGASIDPSYLSYTISGIDTGDVISAKTSVTFTVTLTFTNPLLDQQYDTFIIDGNFAPTVTENINARLYANVNHNSTGDLRGNNTTAAFTIKVMNTHDVQKTFTVSLNTDKFYIRDNNMNSPVQYTIAANTQEATYTFYLVKRNGVDHYTDTERVTVLVDTDGQTQFSAGVISVLVDQNNYYRDENAPIISNVSAQITNTEGSATVSWTGIDEETYPVRYTVIPYRNGVEQTRVQTVGDETTLTLTGLQEGTYYFTVIGEDPAGNTATVAEITNATTSSGHASKSSNIELKWRYTISFNLENCTQKPDATIIRGTDYTTTINPNNNYSITNVSVTLNGSAMDSNGYNFNSSNNSITIYGSYITGNITVTVTTRSNGLCG